MSYSNHLALLIAAPHPGEEAMYRDLTAMVQALPARGDALAFHINLRTIHSEEHASRTRGKNGLSAPKQHPRPR
jgi:hypothetical protein